MVFLCQDNDPQQIFLQGLSTGTKYENYFFFASGTDIKGLEEKKSCLVPDTTFKKRLRYYQVPNKRSYILFNYLIIYLFNRII